MLYTSTLDARIPKRFLESRAEFVAALEKWRQNLCEDVVDINYDQTWENGFTVEFIPRNPNSFSFWLVYFGTSDQKDSEPNQKIRFQFADGRQGFEGMMTMYEVLQLLTAAKEGRFSVWRWRWHEEVRINMDGYVITRFSYYLPCAGKIAAAIIRTFKMEPRTITRYEPWIS